MSKWRPIGWEKHYNGEWLKGHHGEPEINFEAGADAMLESICEEIEKVENLYKPPSVHSFAVFEECRLQILTLLRSEKEV